MAAAGSGVWAERAAAHATPHVLEMLFPDDGYVLVTNRGLIFGDRSRSGWRLMCAEALKINTSERPSLVDLPGKRLLVGTSQGLSTSSDEGCHWLGVEPFASTSIPELMRDPTAPQRLYLAAYDGEADDKGGLFVSEDSGASWQKLLAANRRDYVRSIRVARSDPKRIYATGQSWDESGKYTYYLTQSRDGGKSWERTIVALESNELELWLYDVHPSKPDVITARAGGKMPAEIPERLLVSRDAGKTWSSPLQIRLLSALAFNSDGSRAWVVGQDGLYESTGELASWKRVGAAESLSYVIEREGELLVAGYYAGFGAGPNGVGSMRMPPDGYESFMQLTEVGSQVMCEASSPTAKDCAPYWLDWQRELNSGQFTSDGGVPLDAGAAGSPPAAGSGGTLAAGSSAGPAGTPAAGSGGAPGGGSDGSCAAASARGGAAAGLWAWLIAAAALFGRRRR